jgi:hypothetical protein
MSSVAGLLFVGGTWTIALDIDGKQDVALVISGGGFLCDRTVPASVMVLTPGAATSN